MMARVNTTNVRSGPSRRACYLRFINRTSRKVSVIWLDYIGYAVTYGTLEPNRYFDIHTYEGHPWISEDTVTRTRMLLNRTLILYPTPMVNENAENNSNNNNSHREHRCYLPLLSNEPNRNSSDMELEREIVNITIPVIPLKVRCSETIMTNLGSVLDVDRLQLPTVLKKMVRSHFLPPQ